MEKFDNKIIDMRDVYEDWKERYSGGGGGHDVSAEAMVDDVQERVIVVRRGVVVVCFRSCTLCLFYLTIFALLT